MGFSASSNNKVPQDLSRQNALLKGVEKATLQLLSIADIDKAIKAALETIATAAGIDCLFIYQHHVDVQTQHEFATCPYEWLAPGLSQFRACHQLSQITEAAR